MLKVPQQQYIRFLREVEGCSINEIAGRARVHWRTAQKYADRADWNEPMTKRNRKSPVMEPFMEIIDTWLEEDRLLPRKQRHTGVRIFQRLRDEHQFTGGQRTVLAYVQKRKGEMELERAKTYERLEHPPGEAQVDFTTIEVSEGHQLLTYKLLVMSFPHSNAAFVYPTPAENQECFLEAMKQCFEQMGGVPQRIWFDNLSAAVVHIEKQGDRQLTEGFQRFCAHYRFEAVFCNPYSGHEKGHVENKCGYSKRNWAVPIPLYENHDQLAAYFAEQAMQDRQRQHYAQNRRIDDLWEDDRRKLLVLPEHGFEAFRLAAAVVNKYGEIRIEDTLVPLMGMAAPGNEMLIQIYWDRLIVLNSQYQQIREVPRPYTGRNADILWSRVFSGWQRKPRSVTHSQFLRMLPEALQEYVTVKDLTERKERLQALSHWSDVYTIEQIQETIALLGQDSLATRITSVLGIKYGARDLPAMWEETLSPPGTRMDASLGQYDRLVGVS